MRVHYREALGLRGWTGPSRHGPMPSDAHLSRFVVSDVAQQQNICVCVPWHLATPPPPRQTQRMCCARLVGNGVATPKSNRQPTVRRHQPPKKRKRKIRHDEAISSFRLLAAHNVVRPSRSTFLSARHKKEKKKRTHLSPVADWFDCWP